MEQLVTKLKQRLPKLDKVKLLFLAGLAGILLIGLSQLRGTESKSQTKTAAPQTDTEYCAETEEKIKQLVTAITGDRACVVAVTLNTGTEYVYANQVTTDTDVTENSNSGQSTTKESRKNEQQYIIMKSENGTEQPLTVTEKKPEVRGVAIVSAGITPERKEKIQSGIAAMLELSTRRISITEKANNS